MAAAQRLLPAETYLVAYEPVIAHLAMNLLIVIVFFLNYNISVEFHVGNNWLQILVVLLSLNKILRPTSLNKAD